MPTRGVIVSDFNASNLAGILANDAEPPDVAVSEAPFGQVDQVLLDPEHPIWAGETDFAVVWTRPEAVLPTFRKARAMEAATTDSLANEVDAFADRVASLRGRVGTIIVPTWVAPRDARGLGPIDLTHPLGVRRLLLAANLRLVHALESVEGTFVLDAEDWIAEGGQDPFNDRLYYLAKIPFSNPVFHRAARDFKAALRSTAGGARKLIVLDLDNTLWGGVVGEDGWENLTLGGHDADGEAFLDFQRELKALSNRGILLAVASKNEESTALEAIDAHPEMLLSRDELAAWRIDWNDKAANIADLVEELGLGLDSVVFIDDSPAERARVSEALPEVLVPEWPRSPARYARALRALRCFDAAALTGEDRERTAMYRRRREAGEERSDVGSIEEWLESLNTVADVVGLNDANRVRAAQLLNKTNQMNLATRRVSEARLVEWAGQDGHQFWVFALSDRFGDHGITGLLGLVVRDREVEIVDFVMSCRVLGRNLERTMLAWAIRQAREAGATRLVATLVPSDRNAPCLDFFRSSGLHEGPELTFGWDVGDDYEPPAGVEVRRLGERRPTGS